MNPENLIGLTYLRAQIILEAEKIPYRVVRVDGVVRIVTRDYKPDRVNLTLDNNKVIHWTWG